MGRRRIGMRVGVAIGVVVVLTLGAYTPLILMAPLPAARATIVPAAPGSPAAAVLPGSGSSAVRLGGSAIAASGDAAVPLAGAVKVITALVVLEEMPLEAGRSGPSVAITAEDEARYRELGGQGVRTVPVHAGQQWTQRDVLQAVLLASSNNHAELAARWAFGSIDGYLDAAAWWLAERGLDSVRVADPTGISAENVGTGADLARIAELAMTTPAVAETVTQSAVTSTQLQQIDNDVAYFAERGVTSLSRSYTDAAGVCLLFAATVVGEGGAEATVYGAFLGEPSYDRLAADLGAFLDAAATSVHEVPLATSGQVFASYETAWGARSSAVTPRAITVTGWAGAVPEAEVDVRPLGTARSGDEVGSVVFPLGDGDREVPLVLDRTLPDPGPLWRLLNPGPLIEEFLD